jgi:hypothetical protein
MQRPPNFLDLDDIAMNTAAFDREYDIYLDTSMAAASGEYQPDPMELDLAPLSPVRQQTHTWDGVEQFKAWQGFGSNPRRTTTTCGACLDLTNHAITIACGCHYCQPCFNNFFESNLANRGSFPPKCCGEEIAVGAVREHLHAAVLKKYEDVREEFGSRNPTYCAVPNCGTFLAGAVIFADFKACQKCSQQTCIRCKNLRALHEGSDKIGETNQIASAGAHHCPGIVVPPELTALVAKEEWNRCPGCRHLVEKTEGCDFMECICGEEFCYKCGQPFDGGETCGCPDNLPDEEDAGEIEGELDEDGEDGEWPHYRAAVDAHGRIRCMHELTSPLDDVDDDDGGVSRCHGCLQEMPDIRSCDTCQLELCGACLG